MMNQDKYIKLLEDYVELQQKIDVISEEAHKKDELVQQAKFEVKAYQKREQEYKKTSEPLPPLAAKECNCKNYDLLDVAICPRCRESRLDHTMNYCSKCGQPLDWLTFIK